MKKILLFLFAIVLQFGLYAQCSMCTKTASQLGEKPAQGLNAGILYLMFTPLVIIAFIGWRWWKGNRAGELSNLK
jgi:hypothetical protein